MTDITSTRCYTELHYHRHDPATIRAMINDWTRRGRINANQAAFLRDCYAVAIPTETTSTTKTIQED